MFGECLQKAWANSNLPISKLETLITSLSTSPEGFTFTSNATKEILLSQAPAELRTLIQDKDSEAIASLLLELTKGKYENQSSDGLDIAFELMEWLLTGFEDEIKFTEILKSFLGEAPEISDTLITTLRKEYDLALRS